MENKNHLTLVAQKTAFNNLLDNLLSDVENGERNPLDVFTVIDDVEKKLNTLKKKLKSKALDEASLHGEKKFDWKSYMIELRNGASRFDFNGIKEIEEVKNELKDRQEFFKSGYKSIENGSISKENIKSEIIDGVNRYFFKVDGTWYLSPLKTYSENTIIIKNK